MGLTTRDEHPDPQQHDIIHLPCPIVLARLRDLAVPGIFPYLSESSRYPFQRGDFMKEERGSTRGVTRER